MELSLKISSFDEIDQNILIALRDGKYHYAKFSTTKITIVPDRKDPRFINTLKNVKIVLKKEDDGILILMGNLQCDYRPPFGGAFFIRKVINETTEYASVRGVSARVRFANTINEDITDNQTLTQFMSAY